MPVLALSATVLAMPAKIVFYSITLDYIISIMGFLAGGTNGSHPT